MLNMPIKEIRELISLREEFWENDFETNCYAFALGLDIPENDICKNAFQPGIIAANVLNIPVSEIVKLKIEDRIILDFKVLKLGYKITETDERQNNRTLGNYWCKSWDVLLFLKESEFHFTRVNSDGEMYHKIGYFGIPQKTSIEENEKRGYTFSKRYRLRCWEK
ncbi:MAG: hypothetical protein ACI33S_02830 [Bacilli bacterium]